MRTITAIAVACSMWSCMSGVSQKQTDFPNEPNTLKRIEDGGLAVGCTVMRTDKAIIVGCAEKGSLVFTSQDNKLVLTCMGKMTDTCSPFANQLMDAGAKGGPPEPAPEPQSHAGAKGDITPTGVGPARLGAKPAAIEAAWGKADASEQTGTNKEKMMFHWYAKGVSALTDAGGTIEAVMLHSGRCCMTVPSGKVDDAKFQPFSGSTSDGISIDSTRTSVRTAWDYPMMASKQGSIWTRPEASYSFTWTEEGRILYLTVVAAPKT